MTILKKNLADVSFHNNYLFIFLVFNRLYKKKKKKNSTF